MVKLPQTNFAHLKQHDAQLLRLSMLAEKYFAEDANTCLLKLSQLSKLLAQLVAASVIPNCNSNWRVGKLIFMLVPDCEMTRRNS